VYVESNYSEDYSHIIINKDSPADEWSLLSLNEYVYNLEGLSEKEFKEKHKGYWKERRLSIKSDIAKKESTRVVSLNTLQKPSQSLKDLLIKSKNDPSKVYCLENYYLYKGRSLAFFSKKMRSINGRLVPSEILTNVFTHINYLSLGHESEGVPFPNSQKPLGLLRTLIQLFKDKNAVILDCFVGSGTTGHAVMKLNAEDGGQRQYICVQIPEKLDPKNKNQATACDFLDGIEKPRTIAEITKERLRRAGAKIRQEHPDFNGDLGFKVFKQVPSQQLLASQGLDLTTTTELDLEALREAQIRNQQPSLPLESVNPLHLAYEVMLKRHTYPLTAPIERITFAGHDDCFRLGSEEGALCIFATEININAIIKGLIEILEHDDSAFPTAVYMLENAFHSAGEYNDFASALEQLSTHYNIGTGKAERGEQPTLKFYTL